MPRWSRRTACRSSGPPRYPRRVRTALPILVALGVACGSSATPTPPPSTVPSPGRASGPLSRFEVYTALLAQSSLPLSQGEHCDGVVGGTLQRPPTLGDWIAWNLNVLDEADEEGPITLPLECRAAEGHAGEWECDARFDAGQGGESPWSWGVRARFRDADASLVAGSLVCTGAG